MTVSQLRALANTVDASVGDATLLLFSGGVGDLLSDGSTYQYGAGEIASALSDGATVKTIKNTQAADFLNDLNFQAALQDAIDNDPSYMGQTLSQVLEGRDASGVRINNTSFWDDASRNLVSQHDGDIRLIMPNAPDDSVAMQTELPALLEKSGSQTQKINGIDLVEWQRSHDATVVAETAKNITSGQTLAEAKANANASAFQDIKDLVRKTSAADLADTNIGKD